jgi:predicted secreted protein
MSRFGPNGEMNGTDIVVMIEQVRDSGTFIVIGSQRGATINETTAPIDCSSKEGRAYRGIPGRYQSTISMEALYIPNASGLGALRTAMRDGTKIRLRRRETVPVAIPITGSGVVHRTEACDAVITALNNNAPDQDAAVVSCDFTLDGLWASV